MPFENGTPKPATSGVQLGFSQAVKRKYLKRWEEVFDSTNPNKKLTELANENYPEFLRLGIAAMPKDQVIDQTIREDISPQEKAERMERIRQALERQDAKHE